jgi:hypothetical protein
MMPLTEAEFEFLDAYVYEVYTPAMTGPHTRALRQLGANQMDLSWLITAQHRKVLADGKSPMGSYHAEPVPLPWASREEVLARARELRQELEHHDEPSCSVTG